MSKLKRWQTQAEIAAHRRAQSKYEKSPEEIKKRENRNLARAHEEAAGRARKGDGKDVGHADGNALNNSPKNWIIESRRKNRSYARNKDASKKNPHS